MRRPCHLLAVVCLALFGCGQDPSAVSDSPEPRNVEPADSPPAKQVLLDIKNWDEVQQMVADASGKIVVVDLWSTWCLPCQREFPGLVTLHRQFPDDVVCISVNLDYIGLADEPPESSREKVLEFLNKQQATFQNVISSDADEDVLRRLELGSVPIALVYGPDGQLSKAFHNDDDEYGEEGFNYEDHITPRVQLLLADDSQNDD